MDGLIRLTSRVRIIMEALESQCRLSNAYTYYILSSHSLHTHTTSSPLYLSHINLLSDHPLTNHPSALPGILSQHIILLSDHPLTFHPSALPGILSQHIILLSDHPLTIHPNALPGILSQHINLLSDHPLTIRPSTLPGILSHLKPLF